MENLLSRGCEDVMLKQRHINIGASLYSDPWWMRYYSIPFVIRLAVLDKRHNAICATGRYTVQAI